MQLADNANKGLGRSIVPYYRYAETDYCQLFTL